MKIKTDTSYQYDINDNLIKQTVIVTTEEDGWHIISDGMPPVFKNVLVYDARSHPNNFGCAADRYNVAQRRGNTWLMKGSLAEIEPTHWRELPDKPEEL